MLILLHRRLNSLALFANFIRTVPLILAIAVHIVHEQLLQAQVVNVQKPIQNMSLMFDNLTLDNILLSAL